MVALERAGIPVERYVAYEIEENAISVSRDNYPNIEQCGDVFKADFTKYKGFDLLIGGSPCTHWSIAQSAQARETTASGIGFELFMQYVRALRESKCKYFLYENNKSMSEQIKNEITRHLGVEPIMINSALVSAQNRARYYWTNIPDVKQPENKNISLCDILQKEDFKPYRGGKLIRRKPDLTEKVDKMYMIGATNKQCSIGCRVYDLHGKSKTLCSQAGGGGAKAGLYFVDGVVKNLTVSGAEKLQTLPVGYTKAIKPEKGISVCGNGWTVDVIAHIFKGLKIQNEVQKARRQDADSLLEKGHKKMDEKKVKEAIEVIKGYRRLDEYMNNTERLPYCDMAIEALEKQLPKNDLISRKELISRLNNSANRYHGGKCNDVEYKDVETFDVDEVYEIIDRVWEGVPEDNGEID